MAEYLIDTNVLSEIFYGDAYVKQFVENIDTGIETVVYIESIKGSLAKKDRGLIKRTLAKIKYYSLNSEIAMRNVLLIILSSMVLGLSASAQCLNYEPDVVSLSGTIVRRTYPGRPNYSSIKNGDEPEKYWIIRLNKAICVNQADDLNLGERSQNEIQLVLDESQYKKYRGMLGKKVTVKGTLFHGNTGHHHKKLLLTVNKLQFYK